MKENQKGQIHQNDSYEDMLCLERPVSKSHAPMQMSAQAAQFSPFAALTGYENAIEEEGRLTEEKREPDENQKAVLDLQLSYIREHIAEHPVVTLCFFLPDEKKVGGTYQNICGRIKKIDDYERCLMLESGDRIPIENIWTLHEGEE